MGCVPVKGTKTRDGIYNITQATASDDSDDGEDVPERYHRVAGLAIARFSKAGGSLGYVEFNTMLAALGLPLNDPEEFRRACEKHGCSADVGVSCMHLALLLRTSRSIYDRALDLVTQKETRSTLAITYRQPKSKGASEPPKCPICLEMMLFSPEHKHHEGWECSICETFSLAACWRCPTTACVTHYCLLCCAAPRRQDSITSVDSQPLVSEVRRESDAVQIRWGRGGRLQF